MLLTLFISSISFGKEQIIFSYKIANSYKVFLKKNNLLANRSCFDSDKCLALKVFKTQSQKGSPRVLNLKNGKNPGSVICKQRFGGIVVIGYDLDDNQATFCQFEDNSFLAIDSINYKYSRGGIR